MTKAVYEIGLATILLLSDTDDSLGTIGN